MMNAQICQSQTGEASTTPTNRLTKMKMENASVGVEKLTVAIAVPFLEAATARTGPVISS